MKGLASVSAYKKIQLPYPRYCSPGVLFFDMGFWMGSIQKVLQKVDFLSQKWGFIQEKPQKLDFSITWGSIQEWGSNIADTVIGDYQYRTI